MRKKADQPEKPRRMIIDINGKPRLEGPYGAQPDDVIARCREINWDDTGVSPDMEDDVKELWKESVAPNMANLLDAEPLKEDAE